MQRSQPHGDPPAERTASPVPDLVFSALSHGAAILTLLLAANHAAGLHGLWRHAEDLAW